MLEISDYQIGSNHRLYMTAIVKQEPGNSGWISFIKDVDDYAYFGLFSDGERNRIHFQWNDWDVEGEQHTYSFRIDLGEFPVADNEWHTIIFSINEGIARFWKDGTLGVASQVEGPTFQVPLNRFETVLQNGNGGYYGYTFKGELALIEVSDNIYSPGSVSVFVLEHFLDNYVGRCGTSHDPFFQFVEVTPETQKAHHHEYFGHTLATVRFTPGIKDITNVLNLHPLPSQPVSADPVLPAQSVNEPAVQKEMVQQNQRAHNGASAGVIVAIVIGCMAVVGLAVAGIIAYSRREPQRYIYTELQ